VWVELRELSNRSLSSGGVAYISLADVEVGSTVCDGDLSGIVDVDLLGTSKDQVLGSLYTETTHTNNENLHLDQLAHSFQTKGTDLSRVKVGIDFHFWCAHLFFCIIPDDLDASRSTLFERHPRHMFMQVNGHITGGRLQSLPFRRGGLLPHGCWN